MICNNDICKICDYNKHFKNLNFQFKISDFLNFIKNAKYIINLLFIFFSFICNQKYFKPPLIFYNHDYCTIISSFLQKLQNKFHNLQDKFHLNISI